MSAAGREAPVIETERLRLRASEARDFDDAARLWGDAEVTRHIGGTPSTRSESWLRMLRFPGLWSLLGYGYWTLETRDGAFAGQVGLAEFKRDMTPDISGMPESGWVLSPAAHGRGYATEAMRAVLGWADDTLDDPETCCLITPENHASIRVAEKLGYALWREGAIRDERCLVFKRPRGG